MLFRMNGNSDTGLASTTFLRTRPDILVLASLALLAIVAWGAPLFFAPEALYWDDWVVSGTDTLRWARESGLPWIGYLHVALFALGPWSFKVLAILTTIAVGWLVYLISGRGLGLGRNERWLLAALVVALPLYTTRILAILTTYDWSLAVFVLAWWLLVRRDPAAPGRARYVVAALLLVVSYTTASLLPFTVLPLAHLALLGLPREGAVWRRVLRFAGRFWYLFAAPVAFWLARTLFLTPYGLYEDYNEVGHGLGARVALSALGMVAIALVALVVFLYWSAARRPRAAARDGIGTLALSAAVAALSVFLYFTRVSSGPSARTLPLVIGVAALVLAVVAVVRIVTGGDEPGRSVRDITPLLAVGVATLVIAVLPYLVVGKIPTFAGWETRHQLLMPFGVAAIAVATVRAASLVLPRPVIRAVSVIIVAGMTVVSALVSLTLVADWNKQVQVTEALSGEPLVREAITVVFVDDARSFNYDSRTYDFYEYTGWMSTAFGDEKRLGLDIVGLPGFLDGELEPLYYASARYRFGGWVPTNDGVVVTIDKLPGASWWSLLLNQPSIGISVDDVGDLAGLRG